MNELNKQASKSSGLGIVGVLTLIFVVLKKVGVINWSWGWVLSPLWISCGLAIILAIVCIVIYTVQKRKK